MDSGEESEVELSSHDGEGEFIGERPKKGKYFLRNVVSCCTKCYIRLTIPLLNTIKRHATMCNKCCIMFYEILYPFGRGFTFGS